MLKNLQDKKLFFIIFIFLTMFFSFACENRQKYTGLYRAEEGGFQQESETIIELKEDGQGVWRVEDDEASFSWGLKGNEIRLHTKTGGVLKGIIKNNGIEIILPNSENIFFNKIK
jgi:hypothetical protein